MRILLIHPWIRQGGAEQLVVQLAAGLESLGHTAPIVTLYVDPRGLPAATASRRYILPPAALAAAFARSRALVYLLGTPVLTALALAASRDADVLDPHNLPGPIVAAVVGRVRRIPVVWNLNEVPVPLPAEQARRLGLLETLAWRVGSALAALTAGAPRAILVLDEKTRRSVQARYGRDALVVMPGLEVASFRAEPRRTEDGPRLLLVAKLHPQKNPALALHVLARVSASRPGARLTVVGDGPLRPDLDSLARDLGVSDHLSYRANLSTEELRQLYAASDVLLVTSTGHQAWGLTPWEALAAGTPAVVSDEAGTAEVLAAHESALVVRPDADAFAAAVERLLSTPGLSARLVENGRRLLEEELSWRRYAERCAAVFAAARAK